VSGVCVCVCVGPSRRFWSGGEQKGGRELGLRSPWLFITIMCHTVNYHYDTPTLQGTREEKEHRIGLAV